MVKRIADSIPLHDPLYIESLMLEESLAYRQRLQRWVNRLRLFTVVLSALMFLASGKMPREGLNELLAFLPQTQAIIIFGFLYIAILVAHQIVLRKPIEREWIFLTNAALDFFALFALLMCFSITEHWSIMAMLLISTLLLSLLVLTFRQALILAVVTLIILMLAFLVWRLSPYITQSILDPLPLSTRLHNIRKDIANNLNLLLEPWMAFSAIATIIALVGYLSEQARENKIRAMVNHRFNEQLRKLNESVIEDMQSGFLVVNAKGVIITCNQRIRHIFQLGRDEKISYNISSLSPVIAQRFGRWLHMQLNDHNAINLPSGEYTVSFSALKMEAQTGMTLVTFENTEESYQRVRETRLASLGRLTAGIAHEIRNPLGAIQSATELLEESDGDRETLIFLTEKIRKNIKRVNSIIHDILNMFSDRPRNTQLIAINPFLAKVAMEIADNHEMQQTRILLETAASHGYAVYFDPGHLQQILHNLMLNAVKHNRDRTITIILRTRLAQVGRHLYIDVEDNGTGIASEDCERIFEPFFSKDQGTGLGLYMVREMCMANRAQIAALPKEGGACLRITTERYRAENGSMAAPRGAQTPSAGRL
ncbi:MAG: ATP-binding protein [Cardiobacteriaceae bacterium]|nr:ATP-binding protein [Cardiobacteriaceae bacterium]